MTETVPIKIEKLRFYAQKLPVKTLLVDLLSQSLTEADPAAQVD